MAKSQKRSGKEPKKTKDETKVGKKEGPKYLRDSTMGTTAQLGSHKPVKK